MSEQDEALRLAEMTPSLRGGDWGDRAATELRRLHAEAERLRAGLTKANSQAEHFEREWYLRGDEVERLQAVGMTEIDIADDDALRFVQRVLETNAPEADRLDARAKVSAIRTRVLKARATSQPDPVWSPAYTRGPARKSAPVAATSAMVPMKLVEINDVGLAPAVIKPFTPAQRRRLWDNSKEHHKDAANITGFERIVTLTERAHGIGLTVGDGGTV